MESPHVNMPHQVLVKIAKESICFSSDNQPISQRNFCATGDEDDSCHGDIGLKKTKLT